MQAKPKRGRPPLVPGRRRGSPQLKATVSDEEHRKVLRYCADNDLTVSDLVRVRLVDILHGP